jgi:outer membrane protein assembly factor BamB
MKAAALLVALTATAFAEDWKHYRGPKFDGSTTETVEAFPKSGPRELWRVQLGTGHSSMAVAGRWLYSAGYKDGHEVLVCLDTATGKSVWTQSWLAKLGDYLFEGGPRATPTIDGDRVYMVGADGHVGCYAAADGKVLWEKNLVKDFGGKRMDWGFCGSATIDGENVLLDCGGKGASTIALNKKTGATVWKAGDDEPGYGSVCVAMVDGKRTAVVFKASALVGHDADKGTVLWRIEWQTAWKINAITPLVVGDLIIISSAYNHGAAAVRVKGGKAEQVWFTKKLMSQFNSPVHRDGYLYGIDGEVGKRSALVCLDVKTGDEKWRAKEVKNGSLILAGHKLLALTETGDLILAECSPGSYTELARKKVLEDRCWVQPVLANGVIYCRNNVGELVALAAGTK